MLPNRDDGPVATAATELVFAAFATRKHFRDPERCADKIIRPMMEELSLMGPVAVAAATRDIPHLGELLRARTAAKQAIVENCLRCPARARCPLGKEM